MKMSATRALGLALTGVTFMTISGAGLAHADRRAAPITYANAQTDIATPEPVPVPRPMSNAPAVTENRRVEFQYPSQGGETVAVAVTPASPLLPAPSALPSFTDLDQAPSKPIRIASVDAQTTARTGKPLTLSRVKSDRDAKMTEERGLAGIYMDGFEGEPTANGEIFDETAMTAAHPSLPLPSLVQVINEENSREVVVRVNDRGPFDGKRILELSPRAASVLGMPERGSASVRLRYLGPAPVQQNPETYASPFMESESMPPVRQVQAPAPRPVAVANSYAPPAIAKAPVTLANVSVVRAQPSGNVFIQAGAFSDISNAQRLTSSIGAGLPVKIEEARVNGGDFFRVLVGPFPSRDMAERERVELSRAGIVDGFVTTR